MKGKKIIVPAVSVLLVLCLCGCSLLPESESSAPEYDLNIAFRSVDEMLEYAVRNSDTDPRFYAVMEDGRMTLYELKFLPEGYTLDMITLEGTVLTFAYLPESKSELMAITVRWDLNAIGDGRTMLKEFVKDHKTLKRANKNSDVFCDAYTGGDRSEGYSIYFQQAEIMFTLYMPSRHWNDALKIRSNLVNPMTVNIYE